MNEKLVFQFSLNGTPLPIDQIVPVQQDRGGIILNGETSAWPRGLRFDFEGVGGFKAKLNKLRNDEAGGDHSFNLNVNNGALTITTLKPNRIPTGSYDYRLQIADLELDNGAGRVKITEDSPVIIPVNVNLESRIVRLKDGINDDALMADRINGGSRLDGRPILNWLQDNRPRAKRKACLLNLLAVLRTFPTPDSPFLQHIQEIFFADVDRIYAKVDIDLFTRLQELDADPTQPFSLDHGPLHSTHMMIKRRFPVEDQDASEHYVFKSFRQDAQPSLQITMAIPPDDKPRGVYADIDLDLGNPKRDINGFFIHLGELMAEGKTDHLKLNRKLAQDPLISNHLHYVLA